MIHSNIVPKVKVREIQQKTLDIIANGLEKSFGPNGSVTAIVKNIDTNGVNIDIEYTKDGHTIIKNMAFMNPIERSVQDILTELTRNVVKEVGDGTTSAILLSNEIFNALCSNSGIDNMSPSEVIKIFNSLTEKISEKILAKAKPCTIDDIYDIAYISTNGNEDISNTIKEVYKKFGLEVNIDVGISNEVDNIVKEYDGMTLDTGFTDICFVNEKSKNRATIKNPQIYCFSDPIDTPEMLSMLDAILDNNILRAFRPNSQVMPVPTVIFGKGISPDTSSYFETVVKLMNSYPGAVPLLMVTDIHQDYLYEDIAKMCGAPFIKKYLNPDIQQKDIEAGLAPTPETICSFCGSADMVQADQLKTKIINPSKMFNEDGSCSNEYDAMLEYLKTQVQKAINEDAGIEQIARAKRRLNSFKGNMVDFLVGGITIADRNNLKAAVEDAVLNCKSAAENGVGYGANFMAFYAVEEEEYNLTDKEQCIFDIIAKSYEKLIYRLYNSCSENINVREAMERSLKQEAPMNVRTGKIDASVKSSIKTDVAILKTISKILTLMYTCNQYLVQTPMHNKYVD